MWRQPTAAGYPSASDAGARADTTIDPTTAGRKEMVLIDSARNALRTRHPEDALDVLARHALKFPHGVYQEERESLQQEAQRALAEAKGGAPHEIREGE